MSDLLLKIRQCKRMGGTKLDLSKMALSALPNDIFELTALETLDISGNQIKSLDKINILQGLRELVASNNAISVLSEDILKLSSLETLRLDGNPIAVSTPALSSCFGSSVRKELQAYFGSSPTGEIASPSFFGASGGGDVASLRKRVAELQLEVKQLKSDGTGGGSTPPRGGGGPDWLSTGSRGGGGMERPTTASSQAVKLWAVEEELAIERNNAKRLQQEVSMLKAEVSKQATLGSASHKSEGRIPAIPGVREVEYEELEIGAQIG